jgi:hypothetical protein
VSANDLHIRKVHGGSADWSECREPERNAERLAQLTPVRAID